MRQVRKFCQEQIGSGSAAGPSMSSGKMLLTEELRDLEQEFPYSPGTAGPSTEGAFRVDHPVFSEEQSQPGRESFLLDERC
jgi:hypothetical protein